MIRKMSLYVCILYSLLVSTICSDFHDKVFNNLLRLCPGQYVPTDNDMELNLTSELDSCCTDNFSNSPLLDKPKYEEYDQSCLFPHTDVEGANQDERSYLMITGPPKDGCFLSDNDAETLEGNHINHPTCYDSDVSPFRRFLPVYSESSGFIYKNPHCASCHGQYDVKQWTTFAFCQDNAAFSYELEDCDFQFVYPGEHDDIQHLECYTDFYSACPVDSVADYVNIQAMTNLSVNELTDACSMENLPRFASGHFAKNVFCFICHYCKNGCNFPFERCIPPVTDTSIRSIRRGFARILDSRVVSQLQTDHDTICESDRDEQVCHELMCPQGQVMTFEGTEKKCQMESIQWTAGKFSILLLLEFDQTVDVHEHSFDTMLTPTRNPWPKRWFIELVYHPFARNVDMIKVDTFLYNVTNASPINSIKHAYVQLTYSRRTVNPGVLIRELENLLIQSPFLTIDGKRYKARQSLSKANLWTIIAELSPGDVRKVSMPAWQLSPSIEPYNRWLYKFLPTSKTRKPAYFLNKLMMCKQVELTSSNFYVITYLNNPIMLYYNRTGQHLFDNEFTIRSNRNGEQSFRLCVSDTRLRSNESVIFQINVQLLVLAVIFGVM